MTDCDARPALDDPNAQIARSLDSQARELASSKHALSVPPPPATDIRILVVEDNPALNRALCDLLAEQGYQTWAAGNGGQALQILREELTPNLLISDVHMPEMDGHTLLEHIRRDPSTRRMPVILLSGDLSAEDRRRAKALGVEEYLTKPLDNIDLLYSVHGILVRQLALEEEIEQRVEAIRNEILALIQHEFRTPLTLIMGYAEFLQESLDKEPDPNDIRYSVKAILEGGQRLHRLIESFLLTVTLNRSALPPDEIFPLDPSALWRESLTMLHNEIEATQLNIYLDEPADPLVVHGVMDLLRQALVHLLDNAIRYRRSESESIRLSTTTRPGYVGWVIQDQGMGLSARQLNELTKPFMRGHELGSGASGIGLGLTLVRQVAELHGGTLSVESTEGEGSTFTLWVVDRDE